MYTNIYFFVNSAWSKKNKTFFPRQSLKVFTFRIKLSDSIFFLLGHSPIAKLIQREK